MKPSGAKILLLDIETAPARAFVWGMYDVNVGTNQLIEDGYILCWSAKWFGSKTVMSDSLFNYPKVFKQDPSDDSKIAESMWKLLDEADIVVTHNGDSFDLKWLNGVFIKHNLPPPSTFRSVDTKKEYKRACRFMSNKLDFIARKLDLGYKVNTGGFELWIECMKGNPKAWARMIKYCKNDTVLLEKLYRRIRPFTKLHPNLCLFNKDSSHVCPACGSLRIKKKGYAYTAVSTFQRYVCLNCGKNIRGTERVHKASLVGA